MAQSRNNQITLSSSLLISITAAMCVQCASQSAKDEVVHSCSEIAVHKCKPSIFYGIYFFKKHSVPTWATHAVCYAARAASTGTSILLLPTQYVRLFGYIYSIPSCPVVPVYDGGAFVLFGCFLGSVVLARVHLHLSSHAKNSRREFPLGTTTRGVVGQAEDGDHPVAAKFAKILPHVQVGFLVLLHQNITKDTADVFRQSLTENKHLIRVLFASVRAAERQKNYVRFTVKYSSCKH